MRMWAHTHTHIHWVISLQAISGWWDFYLCCTFQWCGERQKVLPLVLVMMLLLRLLLFPILSFISLFTFCFMTQRRLSFAWRFYFDFKCTFHHLVFCKSLQKCVRVFVFHVRFAVAHFLCMCLCMCCQRDIIETVCKENIDWNQLPNATWKCRNVSYVV